MTDDPRAQSASGALDEPVAGDALVNLRQPTLHLGLREVPVPRVDGFFEFAVIDRNARLAEQFQAPA
jgi:hypothetical protein